MMIKRLALLICITLTLASLMGTSKPLKVYELTKVNPRSIAKLKATQLSFFGIKLGLSKDDAIRIINDHELLSIAPETDDGLIWILHAKSVGPIMAIEIGTPAEVIVTIHLLDPCANLVKPSMRQAFIFSSSKDPDAKLIATSLLRYLGQSSSTLPIFDAMSTRGDQSDGDIAAMKNKIKIAKAGGNYKYAQRLTIILDYKLEKQTIEDKSGLSDLSRSRLHEQNANLRDASIEGLEPKQAPRSIPPGFMGGETLRRQYLGTTTAPTQDLKVLNANEINDLLLSNTAEFGSAGLTIRYDKGLRVMMLKFEDQTRTTRFTLTMP